MGTNYVAIPVDSEVRLWLHDAFEDAGADLSDGRWPSEEELRSTLNGLVGCGVTVEPTDRGWDAEVGQLDGPGTRPSGLRVKQMARSRSASTKAGWSWRSRSSLSSHAAAGHSCL